MDELALPDSLNIATAYVDANVEAGRGDQTAIFYQDQEVSYAEVLENVNRTGNTLRDLGIGIEDRVALLLLDCPEFIYSFFGAIKIGAIAVPMNTFLRPSDYLYLINDSRAKSVIVSQALLPQIASIHDDLKYLRHVIVVGEAGNYLDFQALLNNASSSLQAEPLSQDDMAFWLYSSGSTGVPKGAVQPQHEGLYVSDLFGQQFMQMTAQDRTFSAAKLFFAYGLGNNMYMPMRVGASAVLLPDRPTPEAMFETISRYRPTIFYGVPTLYAQMLQVENASSRYDLSSLRLCLSAGESLPPELYRRWKDRFGLDICDGIGSTEALHIFIANRPDALRAGSTGKVVPGYEAKIIDEDGHELGVDTVGTLLVRGDSTSPFYWNKHRKTQQTMQGEWLNTGDKFSRDDEGYYWFAGRSDDMLKVGGIWVSPIEVENAIVEHQAVLETAVIGALDEDDLVKPKAYIMLRQGVTPSPELEAELKDFVRNKIAHYKYPRWIEFVDDLPKTATGKIQRFKLREM